MRCSEPAPDRFGIAIHAFRGPTSPATAGLGLRRHRNASAPPSTCSLFRKRAEIRANRKLLDRYEIQSPASDFSRPKFNRRYATDRRLHCVAWAEAHTYLHILAMRGDAGYDKNCPEQACLVRRMGEYDNRIIRTNGARPASVAFSQHGKGDRGRSRSRKSEMIAAPMMKFTTHRWTNPPGA